MPKAIFVMAVAGCLALAAAACCGAGGLEQAKAHYEAGVEFQESGRLTEAMFDRVFTLAKKRAELD